VLNLEGKTPNLAPRLGWSDEKVTDLHALAFLDAGTVRVIDPITAEDRFTLSSLGLGLRLKATSGLNAELLWAYPLKAVGKTARGDHRFHVNVAYEW
jgi:hemolysin activation/secretion protein